MRRDVRKNKWKPASLTFILTLSAFLGVISFYGSETATGTVVGGNISVDTTWTLAGSPYLVIENVIVDPGVTLTIEPGVVVEVDSGWPLLYIFVEGSLNATGSEGDTIIFKARIHPPATFWGGIQINSTGYADIRFCDISGSDSAITIASSSRISVTDNIMTFVPANVKPFGTLTPGHHFANNTINYGAIYLYSPNNTVVDNLFVNSSGVTIYDDNNLVQNNTMVHVYMDSANNNSILDNKILNSTGRGMEIRNSNYNTIANNLISNYTSIGIDLIPVGGSTGNVISENVISGGEVCIDHWGDHGLIENNTIENCSEDGIEDSGIDTIIVGNTITNSWVGILLYRGPCEVFQNEISGSSFIGIWYMSSKNISTYHNNLINNARQAYDDNATGRFWDAGYPLGGNYWSDYSGTDLFSGPNQDIPGSDGIGDTPYLINISSRDRYPLTEPTIGNLPPRNLNAHLTGTNYENVTLTWNLSWNDGQRANDVTGYEVYRSSTYDKERIGYSLIGSTPNQTTQYLDGYAGEGDPNNYFYYVCAINGTGNSSCSSNQAGKFTRPLSKGPNLVSIPLIQSDETIQTVLQTLSYDNAWSYDTISQEWRSFSKSKPYGQSLEYLNHTMGVWVNVTQDSNLTVAGVVPTSTTIDLQAGWNLVGFPSFDDNFTVTDLKAVVALETIEGFDALAPPYFLRVMADGDFLQAGFGYWIKVQSPVFWTVENV